MKLKKKVKNILKVVGIYVIAMVCVLMMAERVERLNEIERSKNEVSISVKIDK